MIQGPQLINQALSGIAERLRNPTVAPDPQLLSSAIVNSHFAEATHRLTRLDQAVTDGTVSAFDRASSAEAIARIATEGIRSELVRAETILQIAQEAFTAIEVLYGGMQELARQALDEGLTDKQRARINAEFQDLKQDVQDIINATVFDDEPLLKGGEGPEGEFVIRLSSVGEAGLPLDILVPAGSLFDQVEGLEDANLLKPEFALAAMTASEKAVEILAGYGDLMETQRATLQRIYATDIAPNQSLSDYVATFETPKYAEGLSELVADIVLAGGEVPFEDRADRLRDIFARMPEAELSPGERAAVAVTPTQVTAQLTAQITINQAYGSQTPSPVLPTLSERAAVTDTSPALGANGDVAETGRPPETVEVRLMRAEDAFAKAEAVLNGMRDKLMALYREAEEVALAGGVESSAEEEKTMALQGLTDRLDGSPHPHAGAAGGFVILVPGAGENAGIRDITVPSLVTADLLPGLTRGLQPGSHSADPVGAQIKNAIADVIDVALTQIGHARAVTAPDAMVPVLPASAPGTADVAASPSVTGAATADPEGASDRPKAAVVTAAVQAEQVITDRQRDQLRIEVLDAEVPKLREMDAVKRAVGLVQQAAAGDTRLDAGLAQQRTVYEPTADQPPSFGESIPAEPGSVMAELQRADHMLHVADLSIEQMDLNLDYIRGLAEEAAGDSSRYRPALNEIFQVVKLNIIDNLAETVEARGERILSGGDGPDGEFVIQLPTGILPGAAHDIAVPSMRVRDLSSDLFYTHIKTSDAAGSAVTQLEQASETTASVREMIAEQRTLIRQMMVADITQNRAAPEAA